MKYLSVIICDDVKYDEYIMLIHLGSFYAISNKILRIFQNGYIDVKLYIFHAYC